jgi:hypothetical protein
MIYKIMSNNMEILIHQNDYASYQIINELVRRIPKAKLEYIVRISKYYNNNKSKYNSQDSINEIIIDCIKSS